MSTNLNSTSANADIAEAFHLAGLTMETSRWGNLQARVADRIIRVYEDDVTFKVVVMTANELVESELSVSGRMANPVALAGLIELAAGE